MNNYTCEYDNIQLGSAYPDKDWAFVSITVKEDFGYGDSATTTLSLRQALAVYSFLGKVLGEVS